MVTVKRENKQIICGVYSIRNIVNNKRYVGSSIDIYGRWTTHVRKLENNKHDNEHLQKAWNKYGKDNFEFVILETCEADDRFDVEQKWYEIYKVYERDFGYNIAKIARCPESDYTIEDIKNGKSLMTYDQFVQLIDLLVNTTIPLTEVGKMVGLEKSMVNGIFYKTRYKKLVDDYDFKPRKHFIKNKLTIEEVKEIIEKLKLGMHPIDISDEYSVKDRAIFSIRNHETWKELTKDIEFPPLQKHRSGYNHEKVTQYDLNGSIVGVYVNNIVAYENTGISYAAISQVCLGKVRTAGGYIWRYDDDPFDKYPVEKKDVHMPFGQKPTPVDQYKDGVYIQTFESASEARRVTGANNIFNVLNGKRKQSGGFEWRRHIDNDYCD